MSDFANFGRDLRSLLSGFLEPHDENGVRKAVSEPRRFDETLFAGGLNRMVGSGGELLIKNPDTPESPRDKMEVGDCLIGIGATHLVENLDQPPGPDAFRATSLNTPGDKKMAMRAFRIADKTEGANGFDIRLSPLSPKEYSLLVAQVSGGLVHVPPSTIPAGTMIISFVDPQSQYTLKSIGASVAPLWAAATTGSRYWTVGVGKAEDFWEASFPSDDINFLRMMESSERVGSIRFGLTLLDSGVSKLSFDSVTHSTSGKSTHHEFVLSGAAAGTKGLDSPFPIGLRTEIVCRPK